MGLPALLLSFVPLLLMLLPGFFAFVAAAWGPVYLGIALFTSALCAFAAAGLDIFTGILLLCLYVPATLVLVYHLVKKRPWRNAAAITAGALAAGLYCMLCLPSLLAGQGPFGQFTEIMTTVTRQLVQAARDLQAPAATISLLEDYAAYLQLMAPDLLTSLLVAMAMACGFFDTLIARGLCRAAGTPLRPMTAFHNWQLGKSFTYALLILLAGAFAVLLLDLNNATAMATAIEWIIGAPLALMGICFIAYYRRLRQKGTLYLVIAYGLIFLLLPTSSYILIGLGFFDRILRIRKRHPLP